MFPRHLQHAKRPAQALRHERPDLLGGFGIGAGVFGHDDAVTRTVDRQGQVRVFGDGLTREQPGGNDCLGAPGANRTGHHQNAVENLISAAVDVLADPILKILAGRQPVARIAHLNDARDGADFRINEGLHDPGDRIPLQHGVGIEDNEELGLQIAQRRI